MHWKKSVNKGINSKCGKDDYWQQTKPQNTRAGWHAIFHTSTVMSSLPLVNFSIPSSGEGLPPLIISPESIVASSSSWLGLSFMNGSKPWMDCVSNVFHPCDLTLSNLKEGGFLWVPVDGHSSLWWRRHMDTPATAEFKNHSRQCHQRRVKCWDYGDISYSNTDQQEKSSLLDRLAPRTCTPCKALQMI